MNILLDSQILLWYITADSRLSEDVKSAIRNPANRVFLSVASVWEAVITHAIGKLSLPEAPEEYLPRQRQSHGIEAIPIDEGAMPHLAGLPPLHRDPFDRMLIAQALQLDLSLATDDVQVRAYPVKLLP